MTDQNESLKAAIAEVEAANPVKTDAVTVEAVPKAEEVDIPATQGDNAATDDESDDSGDTATSDGGDAPAQRQNRGVGKRINELTREKYEAIRRAEAAERRLQEVEQAKPRAQVHPADSSDRPTLADHGYDPEAHAEAVAEWKYRKLREEERSADARKASEESFQAKLKDVDPADWQEAIAAPINYTDAMLEVIKGTEAGPQIAVYLARNLDEADQISRMSAYNAAAALGRIEAKLSVPAVVTPPSPPRTVTKAPAPAPTVQGTAVAKKSANEKSVEDFLADIRGKSQR